MSARAVTSLRPKLFGRLVWLADGVLVVGALVVMLVAARGDEVVSRPPALPVIEIEKPERVVDPAWTLDAEPVERVGYRHGRRQAIEVVPLGPDGVEVEIRTARAFLAMREAAAAAGVELKLESGFRTAEKQRELFREWRKGRGNKAARPGRSNHQSGRALDIAVLSVPGALEWLESNAAAYGFKRTVKSEPWHWEYENAPIARAAKKRITRKAIGATKVVRRAKRPKRGTSSVAASR